MTIGDRIKEKRIEKGYSLRDLAQIMKYHHSTIGKIENNLVDLPQSRIAQFAEALGTTPAYHTTVSDGLGRRTKEKRCPGRHRC